MADLLNTLGLVAFLAAIAIFGLRIGRRPKLPKIPEPPALIDSDFDQRAAEFGKALK